jgi:sodium-dependent phosphate cotransporter
MGLMVGILVTAMLQSSSLTTSLVVALVAGDKLTGMNALPLSQAVFIIMGADIGTSVTNTLVSLGHITRKEEFKRAFSAATVHDMFNLLTVSVLLPLEYFTGYLKHLSSTIGGMLVGTGGVEFNSPIKYVLDPVANEFKYFICTTLGCGDTAGGIVMIVFAIALLIFSLTRFSRIAKKLLVSRISVLFDKIIFRNPMLAMAMGMIITATVQSSSITTSLLVPLAGAGILTLPQVFPFTIGANIGTTITAFLAALAISNVNGIIIAFAHLFFNITGACLWYPIPQMRRIPLFLAGKLGQKASEKRRVALYFVVGVFFLVPGTSVLLCVLF